MTAPPPPPLVSAADYEQAALGLLDAGTLAYYAGGAGDELTLHDNVAAWRRLAILPRVLVGASAVDPSVTLLGRRRPHPLIIAPMAFGRLAHPDGELASGRAAASTGAVMCLSTLATTSIEELAGGAPEATRWFQLYVFSDRGVSRDLVAQAAAHGYEAIVLTVDLPVLGRRERELRIGAHAPVDDVASARLAGARGMLTPAEFTQLIDPGLTWRDVESFASESPLPVLLKGILTPQDARRAVEHGAAGVIVSNHGGRQLDTVFSGADALPAVAEEVGEEIDVLVDGGLRRGTDVLKALALGARAVLVGRPVLWGLAVDGAAGAQAVLDILLAEFALALALAGSPLATGLDRSFVTAGPWVGPAT